MMHIGTARTALFNWLVARATAGRFLLRMDDTDTDRNTPEAEQPIFDGLTWLGLDWDEFDRQSDRTGIYGVYARRLLDAGLAFCADNGAIILRWKSRWPRIMTATLRRAVRALPDSLIGCRDRALLLIGFAAGATPVRACEPGGA